MTKEHGMWLEALAPLSDETLKSIATGESFVVQAGRRQMIGEWTNDLGGKDPEGDKDFDDWYNETYPAESQTDKSEQS